MFMIAFNIKFCIGKFREKSQLSPVFVEPNEMLMAYKMSSLKGA